jgi:hypothetical protein
MVSDARSLQNAAEGGAVLLINRVLDGSFPTNNGVELIGTLVGAGKGARAMLVSDRDDAQAQAEAAGALPGFGKRAIYSDETKRRLLAAVSPGA